MKYVLLGFGTFVILVAAVIGVTGLLAWRRYKAAGRIDAGLFACIGCVFWVFAILVAFAVSYDLVRYW